MSCSPGRGDGADTAPPASARPRLPITSARTAPTSRKRSSVFAGWTFTSSSSGGTSSQSATSGWRPAAITSRYATRTAPFSTGSATGRPFTVSACAAPVARVTAGEQAKPPMRSGPRSPDTSSIAAAASAPNKAATRAARCCAGSSNSSRPSLSMRKATCGAASASRRTAASACSASVRGCLRNFRRAGVAKNRSDTTTRVPGAPAAGATSDTAPPATEISEACAASRVREVMCRRAAAPIEGSASPRKPSVSMRTRSSSASFEVAWRSTESARVGASMPSPSSVTSMRSMPPPASATPIRVAPASSAFSTSSFTAAAGRSITSPAAMRLTVCGGRMRMAGTGSGLRALNAHAARPVRLASPQAFNTEKAEGHGGPRRKPDAAPGSRPRPVQNHASRAARSILPPWPSVVLGVLRVKILLRPRTQFQASPGRVRQLAIGPARGRASRGEDHNSDYTPRMAEHSIYPRRRRP